MQRTEVPIFYRTFFLPNKKSAKGCAVSIKSSYPLRADLLIGKTVELCRAEVIERVEDPGPERRNVGQENFIGRKFLRRLISTLAATLPAVAVS